MPLFDLILLTVFLIGAYLGLTVVRRFGHTGRAFGGMLIADALLALLALGMRHQGPSSTGDLLGAIATGGAVCLIAVPPVLRDLARRALLADRLRLARMLVDLREQLQPGMGSRPERELIDTIIAVRRGEVDEAIERLRETRAAAAPALRPRIDERIVMTYLYARDWDEAINYFERSFEGGHDRASAQLLVEMVRAYGEVGDLESAATVIERLEGSPLAREPMLAFLLGRSRLMFLAFVGRTGAVEALARPDGPLGAMPPAARSFWSGVARLRAGDRPGARTSLTEAVKLASRDKRARELAMATLEKVDADGIAGPHVVPPRVAALADRLSELATQEEAPAPDAPAAPRLVGVPLARVPVTATLVVVNLLAAAAVWLIFGSTADLGGLVRAGANVKAATTGGEPWRLVTYMFVHVGILHLLINGYGLWVLGKITEQLYGSRRILFLYVAGGLAGGLASISFGGPATSAGASGAVFALLGAALVELGIHRKSYPQRWTGSLMGLLLLLTGANVIVGFLYPLIDQAAHLGGLAAGLLGGLALSRKWRWGQGRAFEVLATALAVTAAASLAWGAYGVATSNYGETLRQQPRIARDFGGVIAEVPESWSEVTDDGVLDPSRLSLLDLDVVKTAVPLEDAVLQRVHDEQFGGARAAGFDRAERAPTQAIGAPAPWIGHELVVHADEMGGEQRYRVLVFGRSGGEVLVLGVAYVPANLAASLRPLFHDILASVRLAAD